MLREKVYRNLEQPRSFILAGLEPSKSSSKAVDDRIINLEELTNTENKVAFARQAFNDAVMAYNTFRQSFPPVMLASAFGHPTDATLLEFEDSAQIQAAPKVSF